MVYHSLSPTGACPWQQKRPPQRTRRETNNRKDVRLLFFYFYSWVTTPRSLERVHVRLLSKNAPLFPQEPVCHSRPRDLLLLHFMQRERQHGWELQFHSNNPSIVAVNTTRFQKMLKSSFVVLSVTSKWCYWCWKPILLGVIFIWKTWKVDTKISWKSTRKTYVRSELKKRRKACWSWSIFTSVANTELNHLTVTHSRYSVRELCFTKQEQWFHLDFLESEKPSICIYYTTLFTVVFLLALQASN